MINKYKQKKEEQQDPWKEQQENQCPKREEVSEVCQEQEKKNNWKRSSSTFKKLQILDD